MTPLARLKPLAAPVIERFLGKKEPPEIEIIQPEETEEITPLIMLPGMLERVTKVVSSASATLSREIETAKATTAIHAPVVRYTFRNAIVRRAGFATWNKSERHNKARSLHELVGPLVNVSELRSCYNWTISHFFGHWLSDAIPAALIDPDLGQPWLPPDPTWSHAEDYLDTLAIPTLAAPLIHAERLIVYSDFSQGSSKRARYQTINDKLHARFGGQEGSEHVYIQRGATGVRRVINQERELIDELVKRNWKIIDLANSSVDEMQRLLCKASIVVGMEGSNLSHAQMSLRPKSKLLLLTPNDRFTTILAGKGKAHRLDVGMVVLRGSHDDGYVADLDEIFRAIDLMENSAKT